MERLPDPRNDRVVKDFDPPPHKPLPSEFLFTKNGLPDWKVLRSHLIKEGRVSKSTCLEVVSRVSEIFGGEPNLVKIKDPVTVVGDIHGQFYDLIKILEVGGDPDSTQYLFLGDYVDRGSFSIETLLLLFCLKISHPDSIWMIRGNHECRQMTTFFNFRDECEYKFDQDVYNAFADTFDTLPLAAVINGKFLGLHGGLSPEMKNLSQISGINRFQEPPRTGLFCDLLWADPIDEEREEHTARNEHYFANDVRGCSYFFGYDAAISFLERNQLLSVIRAHEAQLDGYKMHQTNTVTGFPTIITIFSAPNYCDCYNNKGAVLKFENNTLNIQQFNFTQHPYHLPNFMDVFTWSIPFVSEKVTEMLHAMLHPSLDDQGDLDDVVLPPEVDRMMHRQLPDASSRESTPKEGEGISKRADALRKKVHSVARLMRAFKTLRQQHELVVQLKGVTPGHRIPPGALLKGEMGIRNELQKFVKAKQIDLVNERRPE